MSMDAERVRQSFPLVNQLCALQPVTWFNPKATTLAQGYPHVGLTREQVADASARLTRFAPYLMQVFPQTRASNGIIESDICPLTHLQPVLDARYQHALPGSLWLKKDSHLPVSGSIKARGGIYEVLAHAEKLAIDAGLLKETDNYACLASAPLRQFFSQRRIAVGSTGNLGLSIGIISASLGFDVTVHMSADARAWKKQKLREHGVKVVEYQQDYGVAVAEGRRQAASDPHCFFIDDENSHNLFLGYAVAGERLKQQFAAADIRVDAQHPLLVYLPCGLAAWRLASSWPLAIAFTASLPSRRTLPACCWAYTPACMMRSRYRIWALITVPLRTVWRWGAPPVLSAAQWSVCSAHFILSVTRKCTRCSGCCISMNSWRWNRRRWREWQGRGASARSLKSWHSRASARRHGAACGDGAVSGQRTKSA